MSEDQANSWSNRAEKFLENLKKNFRLSYVDAGPPPSGYIDLFVYSLKPGEEKWRNIMAQHSSKFIEIVSMADLLHKVQQACTGGKKIRYLRIMGHGSTASFRVGYQDMNGSVGQSTLFSMTDKKPTPLYREFEKLKSFLDVNQSVVILDHCNTGTHEAVLIRFSNILGGVNVRGFIDFQYWERSDVQYGQGMCRQCAGHQCHTGVELTRS